MILEYPGASPAKDGGHQPQLEEFEQELHG